MSKVWISTSTQKQTTTKQAKADLVWHGSISVTHNHMKRKYVGPLNVVDVDWCAWVIQLSSLVDGDANASHWTSANAKPKEYSVYTKQANNKLTISPWPSLVFKGKNCDTVSVHLSINMSNQQQYSLKKIDKWSTDVYCLLWSAHDTELDISINIIILLWIIKSTKFKFMGVCFKMITEGRQMLMFLLFHRFEGQKSVDCSASLSSASADSSSSSVASLYQILPIDILLILCSPFHCYMDNSSHPGKNVTMDAYLTAYSHFPSMGCKSMGVNPSSTHWWFHFVSLLIVEVGIQGPVAPS